MQKKVKSKQRKVIKCILMIQELNKNEVQIS